MAMVDLIPEPLDPASFAPYGTVLDFDPARGRLVNEGTALRADSRALFDHAPGTRPILAFYRLQPQDAPLRLTLFERHPASSQSFVSVSVPRFLVVVAPTGGDGLPIVSEARAFVGRRGSGISYRRDQWHMPVMALGEGGDLLMAMAEHGSADDCIEHRLAFPLAIHRTEPGIQEGMIHGA
jgi:ureidoglycolate lyase